CCFTTLLVSQPNLGAVLAQTPAPGQAPLKKLDASGDPLPHGAVARIGTLRFRHPGPVDFVGYSGDGKLLITHSNDSAVRFWDAGAGKQVQSLKLTTRVVIGAGRYYPGARLLLSGDGKILLIGDNGAWKTVEVATGKTLKEFRAESGEGGGNFEP